MSVTGGTAADCGGPYRSGTSSSALSVRPDRRARCLVRTPVFCTSYHESKHQFIIVRDGECRRFYAVPTARVIFTTKTRSDVFSLSQEQVWTFSVLGDRIYDLPHWDNMS